MEEITAFENQCAAVASRTGKRCRHKALRGSDRCAQHSVLAVSAGAGSDSADEASEKADAANKAIAPYEGAAEMSEASGALEVSESSGDDDESETRNGGKAPDGDDANEDDVAKREAVCLKEDSAEATDAEPESGEEPTPHVLMCDEERLIDKINARLTDPALMELRTDVAALRTLMEEHLARLDSIHRGEIKEYNGALDTHGKRIQSLSGELFAAIDKVGRIQERQRQLMTGEEVAALVAELRERVIEAVETMERGASPAELAARLAAAFDSTRLTGRGEGGEI